MIDQERMKQDLARLRDTVAKAADALKLPHLREELAELKEEMNAPEFWNNLERSTAVNRKVSHIESKLDHVKRLETRADDVEAMLELLSEDEDEGIAAECEQELESLSKDADALELETLMRGDYDSCNAVLSLHAGAGGTEAQDWTQMLYRMYTRYCERHGFKVTRQRPAGRRRGRHQERDLSGGRRKRLRFSQKRKGRAPAGAHFPL